MPTSKDRALAAIDHREPDRVPMDYSAKPEVTEALVRHLGDVELPLHILGDALASRLPPPPYRPPPGPSILIFCSHLTPQPALVGQVESRVTSGDGQVFLFRDDPEPLRSEEATLEVIPKCQ